MIEAALRLKRKKKRVPEAPTGLASTGIYRKKKRKAGFYIFEQRLYIADADKISVYCIL